MPCVACRRVDEEEAKLCADSKVALRQLFADFMAQPLSHVLGTVRDVHEAGYVLGAVQASGINFTMEEGRIAAKVRGRAGGRV
jgi:hypothetical protein